VATSNKAPRELNQYGMQGELFEKFVQRLEDNCEILRVSTGVDYRRVLASAAGDLVGRQEVCFPPGWLADLLVPVSFFLSFWF
jgi:hypothetical protein